MNRPPTQYVQSASLAWWRMKTILFRPFDAGKWFVLGFGAWLATLLDGAGSSGGSSYSGDYDYSSESEGMPDFSEGIEKATGWITENWELVLLVGLGIVGLVVVLVLLFGWLSARGKFIFLDNVIHDRAEVAEPWKAFRLEGNSLFLWKLLIGLVEFVVILIPLAGIGWVLYPILSQQDPVWTSPSIFWIGGLSFGVVLFSILASYIGMLIEDFVIPIMHHDRCAFPKAWSRMTEFHRGRFLAIFVYFLWRFVLSLAWGVAFMLFALGTCCLGLLLLAVPFLGTVVALPFHVFFRALGPSFLQQFGPEYDLWKGTSLEVDRV